MAMTVVPVQIHRMEFCCEPTVILLSALFLESCGCERVPRALEMGDLSLGRVKKHENTAYLLQFFFFVKIRAVEDSGGDAASVEEQ